MYFDSRTNPKIEGPHVKVEMSQLEMVLIRDFALAYIERKCKCLDYDYRYVMLYLQYKIKY